MYYLYYVERRLAYVYYYVFVSALCSYETGRHK